MYLLCFVATNNYSQFEKQVETMGIVPGTRYWYRRRHSMRFQRSQNSTGCLRYYDLQSIFQNDCASILHHSRSAAWLNDQSNNGIVTVISKSQNFSFCRISQHFSFGRISNLSLVNHKLLHLPLSSGKTITILSSLEKKISIRKIFPSLFGTRRRAITIHCQDWCFLRCT